MFGGSKITRALANAIAVLILCLGLAGADAPPGRVRIGFCGPLKDIGAVKAAGFDYTWIMHAA